MEIIRFKAEKVHGYLDFDIKFDKKLNFLTGINGAGKTTAIRLILGLLSPSWLNLTQINYDYAEVECSNNGDKIVIKCENLPTEKQKLIIIINNEEPISAKLRSLEVPDDIFDDLNRFEIRQLANRYSRIESIFNDQEAVKKIKELVTPIYLGLDRRIHKGTDIDMMNIYSERDSDYSEYVKGSLYRSMKETLSLIKDKFLENTVEKTKIENRLKNSLIYSSFDVIENKSSDFPIGLNRDIAKTKHKIIEAIHDFAIHGLEDKIKSYFIELEQIQSKLKKSENQKRDTVKKEKEYIELVGQWFINSPQIERIENIISLCEEAQKEISKIHENFLKFTILTNKFFVDSNKILSVKENGQLAVSLPNQTESNIFQLSSGEKQILIMLAQLIFGSHKEIFIIDEPELSLHLGWQEIFVPSIIEASPDTQFILATHAPSIVGSIENEKYCSDLTNQISND